MLVDISTVSAGETVLSLGYHANHQCDYHDRRTYHTTPRLPARARPQELVKGIVQTKKGDRSRRHRGPVSDEPSQH
jgi:hypothetical protein